MFKINTKFNAKIFTDNILKIIEDVSNEALVLSLREIGKLGVSNAKMTGNYKNQTGNLRNSIFAVILNNENEIIYLDRNLKRLTPDRYNTKPETIMNEALQQVLDDLKTQKGYKLAVCAGYWYGVFVELKGFTVLTQSVPNAQTIQNIFQKHFVEVSAKIKPNQEIGYKNYRIGTKKDYLIKYT